VKNSDVNQRLGFLVNEVGRLYGRQFDQRSRQRLGLSRAQCRLLGVLARHDGARPLTQAELADRLDLTAMGVGSLCDRLASGGWIRRQPCPTDRRANEVLLQPKAHKELDAALAISDEVQSHALAGLSAEHRSLLMTLLRHVHRNLTTP
jgi:DNA-binding MarR family transcriptional regulator